MLDRVQEGNNLAQKKIADSRKWRKTFRKLNADPESKYRPVASLTGFNIYTFETYCFTYHAKFQWSDDKYTPVQN